MLLCMHTTSVRIDVPTHEALKRIATAHGTTVGGAVTLAVRTLQQKQMGAQLATGLTADERAWLDADLG